METGPHDPHTVFGVFFWIKHNLERGRESVEMNHLAVRVRVRVRG